MRKTKDTGAASVHVGSITLKLKSHTKWAAPRLGTLECLSRVPSWCDIKEGRLVIAHILNRILDECSEVSMTITPSDDVRREIDTHANKAELLQLGKDA